MRVVEVFADVRCPFTHVLLRRFVERRRAVGADTVLRLRAWPLELVNGEPLDVDHETEVVAALRRRVAGDLFGGYDPARFPASSLPALELAASAYRHDVVTGERASLALRDAMFEEGRDIADRAELDRLATAVGLPAGTAAGAAVEADWHEGQRRGVIGSPHFFLGGAGVFCPGLRVEQRDGALLVEEDPGLSSFLDRCLR